MSQDSQPASEQEINPTAGKVAITNAENALMLIAQDNVRAALLYLNTPNTSETHAERLLGSRLVAYSQNVQEVRLLERIADALEQIAGSQDDLSTQFRRANA